MNGGMNGKVWFNTYRLITARLNAPGEPPLDETDDARYRVFEERNDTHIHTISMMVLPTHILQKAAHRARDYACKYKHLQNNKSALANSYYCTKGWSILTTEAGPFTCSMQSHGHWWRWSLHNHQIQMIVKNGTLVTLISYTHWTRNI